MTPHRIRHALLGTCAAAALTVGVSYGAQAQVTQINGGGSTLATLVYGSIFTNISTQLDSGFSSFNYAPVGSGAGARAVLCNDGTQVEIGNIAPSVVHFGASDNPLTGDQITAWNTNAPQGGGCAVQHGGLALGGPLLQLPTIGTPVTIVTNNPNQTADGGLTFTDPQLCGIFSGKITSWSDPALAGIASRRIPTGPITVVYRADGSGTSALLTAHLAAVCTPGVNSNISFTSTQTFAQLFTTVPGNFVGATGSGGVQASVGLSAAANGGTVTGTSGSIGYISPDYTQVATVHNGNLQYPPVAYVVNHTSGAKMLPDNANTTTALAQAALPTAAQQKIGTSYVPTIADPGVGYPIVGYTTVILPTCYQDPNVAGEISEFLSQIYGVPDYFAIILQQGFVPLPSSLVTIINNNILTNQTGNNLDLGNAGGACGTTYAGR